MSKYPLKIKAGRAVLDVPEADVTRRGNRDFRDIYISRSWGDTSSPNWNRYRNNIRNVSNWDTIMARKTYRIELKVDFDADERHEALLTVAKQYARDFLGSAMLLQDGRKPACVLMTDDTFVGMEEIDILDASENLHEPEAQP